MYETIEDAVFGDENAVNEVLNEYEPFMLFLSIVVRRDAVGKEEKVFSEEAFQMLRQKLIEELPNWKEHCK
ncbi:MAG TPA: helix-turn-helix domain-containing protein [Negativicutes bacterium]|nr:helix-turn-helix domain-containing protein [Negativicutes bacterium]